MFGEILPDVIIVISDNCALEDSEPLNNKPINAVLFDLTLPRKEAHNRSQGIGRLPEGNGTILNVQDCTLPGDHTDCRLYQVSGLWL